MHYAIVCGNCPPTYCGIGQLMPKISRILLERGARVSYLTDNIQREPNPGGHPLPSSVTVHRGDLTSKLRFQDLFNFIRQTRPDYLLIQYQTFGANLTDGFFPLVVRLASPRTRVISMIHEFEGFTLRGRLRQVPALLASHAVLFSDERQLHTSLPYTFNLHTAKSDSIIFGHTAGQALPDFSQALPTTTPLRLAYHGFIQPAKGLLALLHALDQFKPPFHLDIFGALTPLLDYGTLDQVTAYQQEIRQFLDTHPQLSARVTIHGDIDPNSPQFQALLEPVELAIFPFQDGLTTRRSSFLNTLVNSSCLLASHCLPHTHPRLESILNCGPTATDILHFLQDYTELTPTAKQEHYEAQLTLRHWLLGPELEETLYRQLTSEQEPV